MAVVLPQQQRNAGTYRSTPQATGPSLGGTVTATGILSLADRQDATLQVTLGVEVNDTPGAGANDPGWYVFSSSSWEGGHAGRDGVTFPPPLASCDGSTVAAPTARAFVTISRRVALGIDVVLG